MMEECMMENPQIHHEWMMELCMVVQAEDLGPVKCRFRHCSTHATSSQWLIVQNHSDKPMKRAEIQLGDFLPLLVVFALLPMIPDAIPDAFTTYNQGNLGCFRSPFFQRLWHGEFSPWKSWWIPEIGRSWDILKHLGTHWNTGLRLAPCRTLMKYMAISPPWRS